MSLSHQRVTKSKLLRAFLSRNSPSPCLRTAKRKTSLSPTLSLSLSESSPTHHASCARSQLVVQVSRAEYRKKPHCSDSYRAELPTPVLNYRLNGISAACGAKRSTRRNNEAAMFKDGERERGGGNGEREREREGGRERTQRERQKKGVRAHSDTGDSTAAGQEGRDR